MAESGAKPMEGQCADLAKAFEILSQAPQVRLFSLTYKMGRRRTEELVNAMCLILLKKHGEAHAKLTAYSDSGVGNYLAEMIKKHGERLKCSHIDGFKPTDANTLLDIARIFGILVQERLCDKWPRDQAYCAALESSRAAGLQSLDVEEEVKQVCGPDVIHKPNIELSTQTCNLTSFNVSDRNSSHPSSQKSSSGFSSYTLEISTPTNEESKPLSLHTPTESKSQDQLGSRLGKSTKNSNLPQTVEEVTNFSTKAQPIYANDHKPPTQANSSHSIDETFYAFVILHEAEDADEAQRLRVKLEGILSATGATFSDDFAQPGKSTLRCMEDAIENSAFALLLLTQNFNSNHSMTTADSAIVNSLENHHKLNSVIPLLPRENRLSRKSFPLVLRTKVPLDESSRTFERNAVKAIARDSVEAQRKIWMKNQRIKKLHEEQKRLQEENGINANLRRETERFERLRLENETQQSNMFYGASTPMLHQNPSYIHIENAQNVMIGNHSTMNVEHVKSLTEEI